MKGSITKILAVTSMLSIVGTSILLPESAAKEGFFSRHPKLRRVMKGAALGVVTGGIGGVVLGGSVGSGAVAGAGRGAAFSAAKDKWKDMKNKKRSASRDSSSQ